MTSLLIKHIAQCLVYNRCSVNFSMRAIGKLFERATCLCIRLQWNNPEYDLVNFPHVEPQDKMRKEWIEKKLNQVLKLNKNEDTNAKMFSSKC